jgi:hypothetical protein
MLRGFGLMKDGQILRAAAVLFGRAERVEAELPQRLCEGGALDFVVMNSNSTPIDRVDPWPRLGEFGIPTVTRQKCRDLGAAGHSPGHFVRLQRHYAA